jgi:hypothetical protein
MNDAQHLKTIVDNWCPKGAPFDAEPFEIRLMRAFMQATAYAADAHRQINGGQPIRPLKSYPNPTVGFPDEEKRVKIVREGLVPGLDAQSLESYSFANLMSALQLSKKTYAVAIANAMLLAWERTLDIDSVESNRLFRSKHTRWFMDNWDHKIRPILDSRQNALTHPQIGRIIVLANEYIETRGNKDSMMECALDETA